MTSGINKRKVGFIHVIIRIAEAERERGNYKFQYHQSHRLNGTLYNSILQLTTLFTYIRSRISDKSYKKPFTWKRPIVMITFILVRWDPRPNNIAQVEVASYHQSTGVLRFSTVTGNAFHMRIIDIKCSGSPHPSLSKSLLS